MMPQPLIQIIPHRAITGRGDRLQIICLFDKIDDDVLTAMTVRWNHKFVEKREQLPEQLAKYISDFKQPLVDFHRKHRLNVPVDELLHRVSSINICVVDPIFTSLDGEGGYCIPAHSLVVSAFVPTAKLKHLVFHECGHAASGIGYLKKRESSTAEPEPSGCLSSFGWDRHGLSWSKRGKPLQNQVLNWANEGATEHLAREALGLSPAFRGVRENEVATLRRLFYRVPPSKFYDLYFIDGNRDAEPVVAAAAQLERSIVSRFGSHMLDNLEALFTTPSLLQNDPMRMRKMIDELIPKKQPIWTRLFDWI